MTTSIDFTSAECIVWISKKSHNPRTGRKITETGNIYKKLQQTCKNNAIPDVKKKTQKTTDTSICPDGKILNPATKRCVDIKGKIGASLVKSKTDAQVIKGKIDTKVIKSKIDAKVIKGKIDAKIIKSKTTNSEPINCSQVMTMPQWTGTCWANALLMALFYSSQMRNVMLDVSKRWGAIAKTVSAVEVYVLFQNLLHQQYIFKGARTEMPHAIKPETLLKKLYLHNNKKFVLDPDVREGFNSELYVKPLLEFLGFKNEEYMLCDALPNKNNGNWYLYHSILDRITSVKITPGKVDHTITSRGKIKQLPRGMKPKILVILLDEEKTEERVDSIDKYIDEVVAIKTNAVLEVFDGKYNIDSMCLSNFNKKHCIVGHTIAGVTCNNSRYMYNGWMKSTIDKSKGNDQIGAIDLPCELMPYDWLSSEGDFCLSTEQCNLKGKIDSNVVCFNVGSGKRLFFAVRQN
jgi:hypothetical protein